MDPCPAPGGDGSAAGKVPELLAPAGSPDAFRAAIAAGADAVYLGGKRFGARQYAGNFTPQELETALAYAHARDVKVYVTVNTLVHDRELPAAGEYLAGLYSAGADAVLVQDVGLASLAREVVPALPLHASTQMTVHSTEGARFAAAMGFARIVLARELALPEVAAIARALKGTGTGLEVFAHGALCCSYSGQCLLSSVIGGRSGNRGMCAQPCRKPYTLVTGDADGYGRPGALRAIPQDGKYLLSPRDLCTYPRLDRLAGAPVVSLKIEGRMKSAEYVAIVVAAYRKRLDAIAAGTPCAGGCEDAALAIAFNRGFTEGCLFGRRHSAAMGRERPDNRGLCIGTVAGYRPRERIAAIRLLAGIVPVAGDGLYIEEPAAPGTGTGFALKRTPQPEEGTITVPVPAPVRDGAPVYLTSSTALSAQARRIIAGAEGGLRHPVPIDAQVRIGPDGSVAIEGTIGLRDGRTVPVALAAEHLLAPARTQPLTATQIGDQLRRTGGTPFWFPHLALEYGGGMFAPAAALNGLRREFLAPAEQALVAASVPGEEDVRLARERLAAITAEPAGETGPRVAGEGPAPVIAVCTGTVEGVPAAAAAGAGMVLFEPDLSGRPQACRPDPAADGPGAGLTAALASCRQAGIPLVWKLPRITHDDELAVVTALLPALRAEGLSACMAESPGAARAIRNACPDCTVHGGYGLNVFNHHAALALGPLLAPLTLSPELSGAEVAELIRRARAAGSATGFSVLVQGSIEAMVSAHCLREPVCRCGASGKDPPEEGAFLGIRDETGRVFPVAVDRSCRTRVFNADETCLIDRLPELLRAGVTTFLIDGRGRPAAYGARAASLYREAIAAAQQGRGDVLRTIKERVREIARGGITAGPYARGLLER